MRICQRIGFSTLIMRDEQNTPPHIHMHTHTYVHVCAKLLQSCPTLCNPMDYGSLGSSVHGISRTRRLEWTTMPSSRGSSRPRDPTLCLPHWQAGSLPLAPSRKPEIYIYIISIRKRWSYIYPMDWTIRIMKVSIFWQWISAWQIVERKKVHNSNFI